MSEEEKAIETLKEVASDNFSTLGDDISPQMAQNILNVISNQRKEIERLDYELVREEQYTNFYEDLCNKQQKIIEELQKDKKVLIKNNDKVLGTFISKDKIREFIKEELPDDEIMKWNIIYDVNGTDLRIKLEKMLEEK